MLFVQGPHFENHLKKIRLPTLDLFCWVKKIRKQSEAPRCLFFAMESTEQTGPRPVSVPASLSLLDPVWPPLSPMALYQGFTRTVDPGPGGWSALTWGMSGLTYPSHRLVRFIKCQKMAEDWKSPKGHQEESSADKAASLCPVQSPSLGLIRP